MEGKYITILLQKKKKYTGLSHAECVMESVSSVHSLNGENSASLEPKYLSIFFYNEAHSLQ
jgi:hypothetical protein